MTAGDLLVRPFERQDVEAVWLLMRELAVFEGYIDAFAVTPEDLLTHGFGPQPAFGVFVAVHGESIAGIAVHYHIPWTYDLRPMVVLKELFVSDAYRGQGVGDALFARLRIYASEIDASALRWAVLPGNEAAKRFYAAQGGERDGAWEYWTLAFSGSGYGGESETVPSAMIDGRAP